MVKKGLFAENKEINVIENKDVDKFISRRLALNYFKGNEKAWTYCRSFPI
jgi:hypothetical protein